MKMVGEFSPSFELKKTVKMKEVTKTLKLALPMVIGVVGGMLIYEQVKKLTDKV